MNIDISLTLLITVVTVGISAYAFNEKRFLSSMMMKPYKAVHQKEFYRYITSGFVHSNWLHLGLNMWVFYMFGGLIESVIGPLAFVLLYIVGIIVSDIPTALKYQHQPGYSSLGASGGVSAVVFAMIVVFPLAPLRLLFIPIDIPAFIFGTLYLMYSYYMNRRDSDHVNHSAHMWGALFGILFMIVLEPSLAGRFFSEISHWRLPL